MLPESEKMEQAKQQAIHYATALHATAIGWV